MLRVVYIVQVLRNAMIQRAITDAYHMIGRQTLTNQYQLNPEVVVAN